MSKSIISNERECLVCKTTLGLHKHHIYEGSAERKKSERYGCWCYLCGKHHNLSNDGVHFNKRLDHQLKSLCQKRFEETYPELDFMKIFKRNYRKEQDE